MQRWCLAAACAVAFSCVVVPAARAKQRRRGPAERLHGRHHGEAARCVRGEGPRRRRAASVTAPGRQGADDPHPQPGAGRSRRRARAAKLTRVKGGKTVKQFAAAQAAGGFTVWRSYDEPGGIRDQMYAARAHIPAASPSSSRSARRGQGREILALKVTQGARGQRDGTPAGGALQRHPARARVDRDRGRPPADAPLHRRLERQRQADQGPAARTTELWFVPVMNPDGYQYTFDTERLWRKNLRDNDGDGQTTIGDGVDPNRNYPEHFKYDEEGSSKISSSQTYRGPGPASEPETQAIMGLLAPGRLRVQRQLPLQRPVAAVPGGLADRHADGRRPDLLRAVGQPRPARRSRASTRA